jgi:hypothetical protein
MSEVQHWADDEYWTDALDRLSEVRDAGTITLDVARIDEAAFDGDGPAYKLMGAMVSVWEQEGFDGYRGAPRVMMALLVRLAELSNSERTE